MNPCKVFVSPSLSLSNKCNVPLSVHLLLCKGDSPSYLYTCPAIASITTDFTGFICCECES